MRTTRRFGVAGLIAAALSWSPLLVAETPSVPPDPLKSLHFRHLGPIGNRASAIAGEPGNPLVIYIGAASAGAFKTTNGGVKGDPVFADQAVTTTRAHGTAPPTTKTVWTA